MSDDADGPDLSIFDFGDSDDEETHAVQPPPPSSSNKKKAASAKRREKRENEEAEREKRMAEAARPVERRPRQPGERPPVGELLEFVSAQSEVAGLLRDGPLSALSALHGKSEQKLEELLRRWEATARDYKSTASSPTYRYRSIGTLLQRSGGHLDELERVRWASERGSGGGSLDALLLGDSMFERLHRARGERMGALLE